MCGSKPVGITCAKGSRFYFAIDYVYVFKPKTAKHKKTSQVSIVFHDEFVHVVQCYSIKCKKRNHKCCVSRAKLYTSGDIELNPGPVVTQQSRLAAGDCLFRVVSHQLYSKPSYHMNILVLEFNIWVTIQKDSLKVIQTIRSQGI